MNSDAFRRGDKKSDACRAGMNSNEGAGEQRCMQEGDVKSNKGDVKSNKGDVKSDAAR